MKTWRFTFKCECFGAQAEFPFFVDADTYHDATILAEQRRVDQCITSIGQGSMYG